MQARTFGNDVWSCSCGGRRHVLALITSPSTAEEVLHRLGLLEPRPAFRHHGPAPPQLALPPCGLEAGAALSLAPFLVASLDPCVACRVAAEEGAPRSD